MPNSRNTFSPMATPVVTVSAIMMALSGTALAQSAPGTRLTVSVEVLGVAVTNGVPRISYRLVNSASSQEPVLFFVVDAPTGILTIDAPEPASDWLTETRFGGRTAAVWGVLGDVLAPGTSGPTLTFSAKGSPGLVQYWIQGDAAPPPVLPTDAGVVAPTNALDGRYSRTGTTLGVVPPPADGSSLGLTSHLIGVLDVTCGAGGMIPNQGTCTALRSQLQAVREAIVEGVETAARGSLRAFLNLLVAQRGKQIAETAYWLLAANAEVIIGTL